MPFKLRCGRRRRHINNKPSVPNSTGKVKTSTAVPTRFTTTIDSSGVNDENQSYTESEHQEHDEHEGKNTENNGLQLFTTSSMNLLNDEYEQSSSSNGNGKLLNILTVLLMLVTVCFTASCCYIVYRKITRNSQTVTRATISYRENVTSMQSPSYPGTLSQKTSPTILYSEYLTPVKAKPQEEQYSASSNSNSEYDLGHEYEDMESSRDRADVSVQCKRSHEGSCPNLADEYLEPNNEWHSSETQNEYEY